MKFELMYILDPTLGQNKTDALVDAVRNVIDDFGGKASEPDVWGIRKLAYPINKKSEGYYVVQPFEAESKYEVPKHLDRKLMIADDVMRYMIVDMEDDQ